MGGIEIVASVGWMLFLAWCASAIGARVGAAFRRMLAEQFPEGNDRGRFYLEADR